MVVEPLDFLPRQRQQVQNLGAPGQRLAHRLEQCEVLRSGQDPAPGCRIRVDDALQVGEQRGDALHLVDHRPLRELGQERAWVFRREGPVVGGLEGSVRMLGKEGPAKGGLAALPGAGERDRGRMQGSPREFGNEVASDHEVKIGE